MKNQMTTLIRALLLTGALWAEGTFEMKNAKGETVGTVRISPASEGAPDMGVRFDLNLTNLPPGEHAVHIHATPQCAAPAFESAGPHFNPEKQSHGSHAGDLKNIMVISDGTAKATLTATKVSLKAGANSIRGNGGTSLIIHAKADDYHSDPAGNAGPRIACGIIK